jgi:hypothetical protein
MASGPPLQTWKTDSLEGLDRGSRVWWKSSPTAWLPATLQNVGSKECSIALDTDSGPGTGQVLHHAREAHTAALKSYFAISSHHGSVATMNTLCSGCELPLTIIQATDACESGLQIVKAKPDLLVPANPPILDGVNDLTSLSYLNEPSILHDLRQRYDQDQVRAHAACWDCCRR